MNEPKRQRCPRCTVKRAPSMFFITRDGVKLPTRPCRICLAEEGHLTQQGTGA
jgi:hypothetical protein